MSVQVPPYVKQIVDESFITEAMSDPFVRILLLDRRRRTCFGFYFPAVYGLYD